MRIAICDDDEKELHRLTQMLARYQEERGAYDLVLLDVLMPGISGIQAARELGSGIRM